MEIKVGIFTEGKPVARPDGNGNTVLENQAIGVGFHWMKTCVTLLPGKVTLLPEMREISDGNTDRCGISLINT